MSSLGLAPKVSDTSLLRANVIRLDSFGNPSPIMDSGPLWSLSPPPGENFFHAHDALHMYAFGQDISQDLDKVHLAILNHFVGKVLLDVNVLGPFTSPNGSVAPLNARRSVLVHRGLLILRGILAKQEVYQ